MRLFSLKFNILPAISIVCICVVHMAIAWPGYLSAAMLSVVTNLVVVANIPYLVANVLRLKKA